jgi:pilus assembly protein CpaC
MTTSFDSATPAEQVIHLVVGRTMFVDTKHRLTRVYVTDPTVLNSYTANPNQIVLTAIKAGTSTLIVWDESGDSKAYIVSSDVNVEGLTTAMKQAFPADAIQVGVNAERVLLTGYVGTQAAAENAGKLAAQYSKDVSNSLVVNSSRVKQVSLKVRIVEVDRSKLAQFGFNFFSAGGNNLAGTTTGAYSTNLNVSSTGGSTGSTVGGKSVTVTNPLNFVFYSSKLNVGATLQDLANMNLAQILAEPTITTKNGEKANFLAGGEFPFPIVQGGSATQAATVTIQFRSYGVKLEFTPNVNPDGTVDLKVAPEVSALDFSNAVTIAGYTIPAISTRRAETQMVLQNGQSFAISGLLDQRATDTLSKTPGISSIPILGELFKSKSINHSLTELIVIVTPTIVDPMLENVPAPQQHLKVVDPGHPGEVEPDMVVPMVSPHKFDKDLPKYETKPQ